MELLCINNIYTKKTDADALDMILDSFILFEKSWEVIDENAPNAVRTLRPYLETDTFLALRILSEAGGKGRDRHTPGKHPGQQ